MKNKEACPLLFKFGLIPFSGFSNFCRGSLAFWEKVLIRKN